MGIRQQAAVPVGPVAVAGTARALRWLSIRLLAAVFAVALVASGGGRAHADAVSDYEQQNADLEHLLEQRLTAEARLSEAVAAEQAALIRLAAAEARLNRLLGRHRELTALQPALAQQASDLETQLAEADVARERLERRVDAQEDWLFGTDAPEARSMRGYAEALATLDADAAEQEATRARLAETRAAQAAAVDRLGQANTEIAWWDGEAEAWSGQVGSARSRALLASGRLVALQGEGEVLAAAVRAQFDALQSAGHPVGLATIAEGAVPISEPAPWPSVAPPAYALPGGRAIASFAPGAPLQIEKGQPAPGLFDEIPGWTAPVAGQITTPYGDATPYQAAHWALDVGTRLYAPVVAAADGVVEFAGLATSNRLASYGLVVLVRHNERVTTLYAHLDDRARGLAVNAGDAVQQGQVIGYVGLTGLSTGPHLHFEVRAGNRPIDPLLLVRP